MADPTPVSAETPQNGIPAASASDEAAIRAILMEQGALDDPGEAAPTEPAAAAGDEVFDDPAEAAEAAAMASEAGDTGTVEEPAPEAPKAEEPQEDAGAVTRGLASLARRERALSEREARLAQREREMSQQQAQPAQIDDFRRLAVEDPAGFYEQLGVNPAEIAGIMYFQKNLDKAPPDIQARAHTINLQRQVAQMQRERAVEQQRAAQQQNEQAALSYLTSVVSQIPDDLPYLQAEAAEDPAGTAQAMLRRLTVLRDARQLPPGGTDDEIAAVVSQSIEADMKRSAARMQRIQARVTEALAKRNGKTQQAAPAAAPKTAPAAAPKTPAPVAPETKKAQPKTITKQATAITRPPREGASHEDDINRTIANLRAGKMD